MFNCLLYLLQSSQNDYHKGRVSLQDDSLKGGEPSPTEFLANSLAATFNLNDRENLCYVYVCLQSGWDYQTNLSWSLHFCRDRSKV